jgi:5-methylcytosine-specific restriction endonuclease McrA
MSTTVKIDEEKKQTPWTIFQKRVRSLTSLSSPDTMKLCSYLKNRKEMTTWTDDEITTALNEWRLAETDKETPSPKEEKVITRKQDPSDTEEKVKPAKQEKPSKKTKNTSATEAEEDPTVSAPVASVPAESIMSLEFHLIEAKKKRDSAATIAEKEETNAKKATEKAEEAIKKAEEATKKAEEATKIANDLKQKAEKASLAASDARAMVTTCQKEVDTFQKEVKTRTEELEKEIAAATALSTSSTTELPDEPLHIRRKKIPKHIKTLVWNKYIGPDAASAECVSCRTVKISNRSFHCGHVIAESRGGDMTINNLRPICEHCNGSMGTQSMNEFTKEFFGWTV